VLRQVATDGGNVMEPILAAVKTYATLGEICDILRGVYGEYSEAG
jgi:methylmalonyl-CoA mutase N-terminal domain/subunit